MFIRFTKVMATTIAIAIFFVSLGIAREPPAIAPEHAISGTVAWLFYLPFEIIAPSITVERAFSEKFGMAGTAQFVAAPSTYSFSSGSWSNYTYGVALEAAPRFYISKRYIDSIFVSPSVSLTYAPGILDMDVAPAFGATVGRNWVWKKGFLLRLAGGVQVIPWGSAMLGNWIPIYPDLDFQLGYAW